MSSKYILPKLARYIPLWQRPIPKYPLWFRNGPQLRIPMPLFWMKMVNKESALPENEVCFEVHPQMTKQDVKNYLEKIYDTPVEHVAGYNKRGEEHMHPEGAYLLRRDPDRKFVYVRLGEGQKFKFPDFYTEKDSPEEKNMKDMQKMMKGMEKDRQKHWEQEDVPHWFR